MRSVLPPVAALLALSLIAGASAAEPSQQVADFLGKDAIEILKAPEKVECFRIDGKSLRTPENPAKDDGAPQRIRGYTITAQGKDQDAAFGGKIAAVLFDEKTYNFEETKKCLPLPGVAFRVWKGGDSVDVLLCFECSMVVVATGGKDVQTKVEDFDHARAALVSLAKAALPDDKTIQSLKEKE
ncbi:MAG: hypothetical protein L6R28_07130 [Planctomycetes bacterium]|nr:hypothetical protein [Planctomycetota bacterium]